jgi:hypothetical protein
MAQGPRSCPGRLLGTLALLGALGCATDRYVGVIGRDGTYANRGYGLLVPLYPEKLQARWSVVDPSDHLDVPPRLRPRRLDEALDVDGDGRLAVTERARYQRPTLRLYSKTSSTAVLDVDVRILGGKNATHPLEDHFQALVDGLAGTATSTLATSTATRAEGAVRTVKVAPGRTGLLTEVRGPDPRGPGRLDYRVALIDQSLIAEEGRSRRQLIRVELRAARLDDALRADFDRLLARMIAAEQADEPSRRETF